MRVLVACEFSGVVREAFRKRGHDAWSCDLEPAMDHSPYHFQGDVLEHLEDGWDMMIAHPPCTYLCSSGLHWNGRVAGRDEMTHEAMLFVFKLMGEGFIDNPIPKIAMENPIGCISSKYRKPDQIIQPYMFGDDASKSTCLWLKNLPPLFETRRVEPRWVCCGNVLPEGVGKYGCPNCNGDKKSRPRWANQCDSGQNKLGPSDERAALRAITYQGIADAMAEQWGN